MRIHLPAETWVEILEWLDYREFVKKLESELLWDREFSPIVRDWLHEWHKDVRIGSLRFIAEEVKGKNGKMEKRACLQKCLQYSQEKDEQEGQQQQQQHLQKVPIAEVALPRNIKSFNSICVSYLDPSVMCFLHQMRPLLSQVHLTFDRLQVSNYFRYIPPPPCNLSDDYRAALELLLPQITGPLESLTIYHEMLRLFHDHFPAMLASAKTLVYHPQPYDVSTKTLVYNPQCYDEWAWTECLANWLFSPLEEGGGGQTQQRKLNISYIKTKFLAKFMTEIRERFQSPNHRQQRCSFFALLGYSGSIKDTCEENTATGEQLVVRKNDRRQQVLISCHSSTTDNENNPGKIDELEQELLDWDLDNKERKLYVWCPEFGPQMEANGKLKRRSRHPFKRFGEEEAGTSSSGEANISTNKRKRLSDPNKVVN